VAVHTVGFDGSGDAVRALHPLRSRAYCLIEESSSKLILLNLSLEVISYKVIDDKWIIATEFPVPARRAM
jgi:hypothetical protein